MSAAREKVEQDRSVYSGPSVTLSAAIGTYPHTIALKDGRISSDRMRLDFADIPVISRAFAPMARELRFHVSEMAIATFLQAKSCGKSLVLLPVVLAARFQEAALLCRSDSSVQGPADLANRRVGVRAYSQTTGMWVRGILAETASLRPQDMNWVTFEDAHVAEIRDPPWSTRAPAGGDLLAMLRSGQLDAAVFGNEVPNDSGVRAVYPDPASAGKEFQARHGFVPVNHVLTVRQDLAMDRPDLVIELVRLFQAAAALASPQSVGTAVPNRASLNPALALAIRYMTAQAMLPDPLTSDQAWEGLPGDVD